MKKILIVLGIILAAMAEEVITAESKVSIMKEEQSQNDEITTGKEQKSEGEEIDLKKLLLYSYLLQITENNNGTKTCTFCEYFLLTFAYLVNIDDTITNSVTKEKVKEFLKKMCTKIPSSLEGECKEFLDIYGDVVVAIIVQGIDPLQVCPMLHICPSEASLNTWEKASKFIIKEERKLICPLCLLVLTHISNFIKNNKTQTCIEAVLYKICNSLPQILTDKCTDFVKTYYKELVQMLVDLLTPSEVCNYLHLCNHGPKRNNIVEKDVEILTSEIPEYLLHLDQLTNILYDSVCTVCEFAMRSIAKAIDNRKTWDVIEKVVRDVCNHLPETVAKSCFQSVDYYVAAIIDMLSDAVSRPKESCTRLGFCKVDGLLLMQESEPKCTLCEIMADIAYFMN